MAKKEEKRKKVKSLYPVKKCPECFTILGLNDVECFNCGQKVEGPDERGIAKKPFDYKGYSIAVTAWVVFFVYLWLMGWSDLLVRAWKWLWKWIVQIVVSLWDYIVDWIWILWEWITSG
jgi:hypothetical protein